MTKIWDIVWRAIFSIVLSLPVILHPGFVLSMDFQLVPLRGGSVAVRASGEIIDGDAERLTSVLDMARPLAGGWTPLLLSSGGGDAVAALGMSLVIRDRQLMPVVLPGQTCESACASMLFLAGKRSLLAKGATLFFHSCISQSSIPNAKQKCNATISKAMRKEHEITDEMLLVTLDAFVENEEEVSREDRLIHANVAECLAIDRPLWIIDRPRPSRCGTGDLLTRDPFIAGADVDRQTLRVPESAPGQVHPVWFLFHWTPPDQWAFWRIEDGVGLGMRPRGIFRNGPELRLFCSATSVDLAGQNELVLDLRLPASPQTDRAARLIFQMDRNPIVGVPTVDRFSEGPFVVAGQQVTTRFVTRFPPKTWDDLETSASQITVGLVSHNNVTIWARSYSVHGLAKRIKAARSNCVGALQPIR